MSPPQIAIRIAKDGYRLVSHRARPRRPLTSRSGTAPAARAVGGVAHAERRPPDEIARSGADREFSGRVAGRGVAPRLGRGAARHAAGGPAPPRPPAAAHDAAAPDDRPPAGPGPP